MLIWLRSGKLLEENSVNMIQKLVNVFTDMLLVPLIGICKLEDWKNAQQSQKIAF